MIFQLSATSPTWGGVRGFSQVFCHPIGLADINLASDIGGGIFSRISFVSMEKVRYERYHVEQNGGQDFSRKFCLPLKENRAYVFSRITDGVDSEHIER